MIERLDLCANEWQKGCEYTSDTASAYIRKIFIENGIELAINTVDKFLRDKKGIQYVSSFLKLSGYDTDSNIVKFVQIIVCKRTLRTKYSQFAADYKAEKPPLRIISATNALSNKLAENIFGNEETDIFTREFEDIFFSHLPATNEVWLKQKTDSKWRERNKRLKIYIEEHFGKKDDIKL